MCIWRADVDFVSEDRDASIRSFAQRGLMMIVPNHAPAAAVDRINFVRLRNIHHTIHNNGNALEPARSRNMIHPTGDQVRPRYPRGPDSANVWRCE